MSLRTIAALLLFHVALASSASAQIAGSSSASARTFVDASTGLTLDEAIRVALAREPSLRAERTTIDAAKAAGAQAGLRRNPSLSVEHREEPSGTDNQTMITVEWPLDLFRRTGRTAVADNEIAVAQSGVADRERLVAAEVRVRYGELLVAVRELTVLDDLVATTRRQHELLSARVDQGASPPLERDLLDVELRRLEADRLRQLGKSERALFELKQMLGMPPGESLQVRDTLEDFVSRESTATDNSQDDSLANRPDVRQATAGIGLADARIGQAQREGKFDMSVLGGYSRMDSGFPQFGVSAAGVPERVRSLFHYVSVGAMVTLPLFNRNQGEVAAAQAQRLGASAHLDAVRLAAQTEIAAARASDRRAREAANLINAGARTLARQNLAVIQQSYELGRMTVFDVIAEQKRYLELERAYTETLREAYEARSALKKALGEMP